MARIEEEIEKRKNRYDFISSRLSFSNSFWDDIGTLVLTSFKYSFKSGRLSSTQTQGIISILHKGN